MLKVRQTVQIQFCTIVIFFIVFLFWSCDEEPEVVSISVVPEKVTIFKGETQQFNVIITDQNGDRMTKVDVEWVSENEFVAVVNENGLATGTGSGITNITAESEGESGSASLTVKLTTRQRLINTWSTIGGEHKLVLFTNSDQTAYNLFSEGAGVINVNGGYNRDLTYLYGFSDQTSGSFFTVSSFPIFFMFDEEGPSLPALVILDVPSLLSVMTFGIKNSSGDTVQYYASPAIYLYDEQEGSLTIPEIVLYDSEESGSVSISGTLTYTISSVPQETPTPIDFPMFEMKDGHMIITFGEGGLFSRFSSLTSGGEIQSETAVGTWEFLGDSSVLIIEMVEDKPFNEPDSQIVYFTFIEEGRVDLLFEEETCQGDQNTLKSREECLKEYEVLFGLEEGSLISIAHRRFFEMVGGM